MNAFAVVRWFLLVFVVVKEVLYYTWIFPSWWAAHSRAYEVLLQHCTQGGQSRESPPAGLRCETFPRLLYPMSAPRTLMVYELLLKILLCTLTSSLSGFWARRFAYTNRLRAFEFLAGSVSLVSLFLWRFILRAQEEVRASVPGWQIPPAAAYFQKWIAPWMELLYLVFLWFFWSFDIFPA